jgi:membrane associated rhomboid family serine protease
VIPFGDDHGRRGFLPVTLLLLLAMLALYACLWWLPAADRPAFAAWLAFDGTWWHDAVALSPGSAAAVALRGAPWRLLALLGHPLLHTGWLHLLSTLVFVLACGGRLEARSGPLRFLLFLVIATAAGALVAAWFWPNGHPASVGAAALGTACVTAAAVLYPRLWIRCLAPVPFWPLRVELPLLLLLPVWALLQLLPLQILCKPVGATPPMPWTAHVGGAAAGLLLAPLLLWRRPPRIGKPAPRPPD